MPVSSQYVHWVSAGFLVGSLECAGDQSIILMMHTTPPHVHPLTLPLYSRSLTPYPSQMDNASTDWIPHEIQMGMQALTRSRTLKLFHGLRQLEVEHIYPWNHQRMSQWSRAYTGEVASSERRHPRALVYQILRRMVERGSCSSSA